MLLSLVKLLNWRFLTDDFEIPLTRLTAILLLYSTSLGWFYSFHIFLLDDIFSNLGISWIWIWAGKTLFYISASISGIIGGTISDKVERRRLLFVCILLGVLITPSFLVFHELIVYLILSLLLGVSFGLSFPSILAFLANSTSTEARGRVVGFTTLVAFIIMIVTFLSSSVLTFEESIFLSVIVRSLGLLTLLINPCKRVAGKEKSWRSVFTTKSFVLYFIPWLLFSISNGVRNFIDVAFFIDESVIMTGYVLRYLPCGVFALVSGVIADRLGRKIALIFGLIVLGISYALFSFAISPSIYLISQVISGLAWAFIIVTYLTILGDLASSGSKEKYYVFLVVPLIALMPFIALSDVVKLTIDINIITSILSMTIFIAVLPLLYASETLPEDKLRNRKIKEYLRKVRGLLEGEESE